MVDTTRPDACEGRRPSCTHRIKSAAAGALQAYWQSCQEAMASGTCSIGVVTEAVDQTHPLVLEEELQRRTALQKLRRESLVSSAQGIIQR